MQIDHYLYQLFMSVMHFQNKDSELLLKYLLNSLTNSMCTIPFL
jgi:hypothetical protein